MPLGESQGPPDARWRPPIECPTGSAAAGTASEHPLRVLCPALGKLAPARWLALPLLFLGSAGGLTALLELVITPDPAYNEDVAVSAPLLFGCAAALTLLTGTKVTWASRVQRGVLLPGYPIVLLTCALGLDDLHVPMAAALPLGAIAATLLIVLLVRQCDGQSSGCPCSAPGRGARDLRARGSKGTLLSPPPRTGP